MAITVEYRRNYIQEMIKESPASSIASDSSSGAEIVASMSHLFDFLAKTELKPDYTKEEFVTGWTDLIELVARIEKKKMANPK